MSEKDIANIISIVNKQFENRADENVTGEYVAENGVTYHFQTIE